MRPSNKPCDRSCGAPSSEERPSEANGLTDPHNENHVVWGTRCCYAPSPPRVPSGRDGNSPAIYCRVGGHLHLQVPAGRPRCSCGTCWVPITRRDSKQSSRSTHSGRPGSANKAAFTHRYKPPTKNPANPTRLGHPPLFICFQCSGLGILIVPGWNKLLDCRSGLPHCPSVRA